MSVNYMCAWCLVRPECTTSLELAVSYIWLLGVKPGSWGRAASALNCWAIPPVLLKIILFNFFEIRPHFEALASLELAMSMRLALNSETHLCLPPDYVNHTSLLFKQTEVGPSLVTWVVLLSVTTLINSKQSKPYQLCYFEAPDFQLSFDKGSF